MRGNSPLWDLVNDLELALGPIFGGRLSSPMDVMMKARGHFNIEVSSPCHPMIPVSSSYTIGYCVNALFRSPCESSGYANSVLHTCKCLSISCTHIALNDESRRATEKDISEREAQETMCHSAIELLCLAMHANQ